MLIVIEGARDIGSHIGELKKNARKWVAVLRCVALVLALASLAALVQLCRVVPDAPPAGPAPAGDLALKWMVLRLSALALVATLLLFGARTAWSFSHVWLGREGTLEDLDLALRLVAADAGAAGPRRASADLLRVATALQRLRREFEGELLKGPALDALRPR
jgi:hypothetical protein